MRMKTFLWVAPTLLAVDWVLGALLASGVKSLWSFVFSVINFPFGLPHVWLESHWIGARYEIGGNAVNETWSFVTFFFAVVAQAALYSLLIEYWNRRPRRVAKDLAPLQGQQ